MSHNKRKRGAPLGNQNARKHGYYSKVFTPEQYREMPRMSAVQGLDNEITSLRVKIFSVMAQTPDNYDLLLRAMSLLNRMVKNRDRLSPADLRAIRNFTRRYVPDEFGPYSFGGDRLVSPD